MVDAEMGGHFGGVVGKGFVKEDARLANGDAPSLADAGDLGGRKAAGPAAEAEAFGARDVCD